MYRFIVFFFSLLIVALLVPETLHSCGGFQIEDISSSNSNRKLQESSSSVNFNATDSSFNTKISASKLFEHLGDSSWWEVDNSMPPMPNFKNKLLGGRLFLRFIDGPMGTSQQFNTVEDEGEDIQDTNDRKESDGGELPSREQRRYRIRGAGVDQQSESNIYINDNHIITEKHRGKDKDRDRNWDASHKNMRENEAVQVPAQAHRTHNVNGQTAPHRRQRVSPNSHLGGVSDSNFKPIPKEQLRLPSRRQLDVESDVGTASMTAHQQIQAAHRLVQNSSAYHSCYEYRLYVLRSEDGIEDAYYEMTRTNRFCYPAIVVTGLPKCSTTALYHLLSQYPFSRASSGKENCLAKYYSKSILDYFDSLIVKKLRENDVIINGCIDIINNVHVRNILRNPNTFYLVSLIVSCILTYLYALTYLTLFCPTLHCYR